MNNPRLQHDAAAAMATHCLDIIAGCVYPGDHKAVWEEFYQIAKAGIEVYEIQVDRMQRRLRPSKN